MILRPGGVLLKTYRTLQRTLIAPWISRVRQRRIPEGADSQRFESFAGKVKLPIIWVHAASLGELESLWTVVESLGRRGFALTLTVFSPSGLGGLSRLATALRKDGAEVGYVGLSPLEGFWEDALLQAKPKLFLTTKYEAWPDLWASLSRLNIPLSVTCCKPRGSFVWVKRVLAWFGVSLPQMTLFAESEPDQVQMRSLFPEAEVLIAGEPRWDRVRARMGIEVPRVGQLVDMFRESSRPWGTIGSAWFSDLRVLEPVLREMKGTLFVVPHQIDGPHLQKLRSTLSRYFDQVILTSGLQGPVSVRGRTCVVVNEMGLLLEFYRHSDWVFVGGGFEKGVHSTIEPALYGLPLFCGPKKSEVFSEIEALKRLGQLRVVSNSDEALAAFTQIEKLGNYELFGWREAVPRYEGATQVIVGALDARLSTHYST